MYSSILTAAILLIVLLVSMAGAEELKIVGLADSYKKGDIITFTLIAENGLTSEEIKEWNITLKIDEATKIDIPFNMEGKYDGLSGVKMEGKSLFHYGYGSGNADLFADMERNEIKISIDSSIMNKGDHVATLCVYKEGTSQTHTVSTGFTIT